MQILNTVITSSTPDADVMPIGDDATAAVNVVLIVDARTGVGGERLLEKGIWLRKLKILKDDRMDPSFPLQK